MPNDHTLSRGILQYSFFRQLECLVRQHGDMNGQVYWDVFKTLLSEFGTNVGIPNSKIPTPKELAQIDKLAKEVAKKFRDI